MRVKNCRSCMYCKNKRRITRYKPSNYHAVGIVHVYAYCDKHQKRVLDIKKCDEGGAK